MQILKKYWWWGLILIATVLFFAKYADNSKRESEKNNSERIKNERIERNIFNIIKANNANYQWIKELGNKNLQPIMTAELQNLWVQNRPIFFIGSIEDIAIKNPQEYLIKINNNGLNLFLLGTELSLELTCKKEIVDQLTSSHPDVIKSFGLGKSIAVIANISTIESNKIRVQSASSDNKNSFEEKVVKTGIGKCISLKSTEESFPIFSFLGRK